MARISRRDILKALLGLPVLGLFGQRFYAKYSRDIKNSAPPLVEGAAELDSPITIPSARYPVGERIRIGIVGYGMRGPQIFRALGYADETWIKKTTAKDGKPNTYQEMFFQQEDLNVEITGVCDTCLPRGQDMADHAVSLYRSSGGTQQSIPKIYRTYREMLSDNKIDAIMILTPDHWHATMAIDAARAGKHVYLEKPMTQTEAEAKELVKVIEETGVTLQVGHNNRQQASYFKAREVIDSGFIGNVSSVETFTNRNSDDGAWIRAIDPRANESTVLWKEFLKDKQWRELDLDRYFNWQKWFEYGTGPAGNQFTHSFDCVNQVMGLGIPQKVSAVGGLYYFKDPRDIPDVMNCSFLYPDRGLTITYDLSLVNSKYRPITFLGSKGTLEVSNKLTVYPDRSLRINGKKADTNEPIFKYHPGAAGIDAVTSASVAYYEDRGFGGTYDNGERKDVTHLHVKEWLYCLREGKQPSCDVYQGYEETVTFRMANIAYLENRIVEWDAENEKII